MFLDILTWIGIIMVHLMVGAFTYRFGTWIEYRMNGTADRSMPMFVFSTFCGFLSLITLVSVVLLVLLYTAINRFISLLKALGGVN